MSGDADAGCRQGPEAARDVRAPVRPAFARAMLGLNWALALVLAIADVAG